MRRALLFAALLAVPVLAEEEPEEPEAAAPAGGAGAHVGGAGIQAGERDGAARGSRKSEPGGAAAVGASCAQQELWASGTSPAALRDAMRLQSADTTIAYRVRASRLGGMGEFIVYSDSHPGTHLRLSSRPCEVTFRRGGCEADYGSKSINYFTPAKLKQIGRTAAEIRAFDSRYCVVPPAAGKIGSEDFWWLNVHVKSPCQDGQCSRAILHTADSLAAAASPAAPGRAPARPSTCWTAASGRTCCDVMFSPVPAECRAR